MRDVAIVSFAQSAKAREIRNEVEILMPVVQEAVRNSKLARGDIGFTCSGSSDYLQGQSFAAFCRGDDKAVGHPVFAENHSMPGSERFLPEQGNMLSVIEGPWKYILNVKSSMNRPRPRHELYRLDQDFAEKKNLAEAEPERVARFETMVLEWWARNRARHSGVDVKHLTEAGIAEADPATLERLRKLGYVK